VERETPLKNSIATGMSVQSELACNPEKRGKMSRVRDLLENYTSELAAKKMSGGILLAWLTKFCCDLGT